MRRTIRLFVERNTKSSFEANIGIAALWMALSGVIIATVGSRVAATSDDWILAGAWIIGAVLVDLSLLIFTGLGALFVVRRLSNREGDDAIERVHRERILSSMDTPEDRKVERRVMRRRARRAKRPKSQDRS